MMAIFCNRHVLMSKICEKKFTFIKNQDDILGLLLLMASSIFEQSYQKPEAVALISGL